MQSIILVKSRFICAWMNWYPKKTRKKSWKLPKDPRKVQFLFSDEQKLISHFSRIFLLFFRRQPKLFSPISPNIVDKKLSNHPPKSQISYFFTKITISGDLFAFFEKNIQKFQINYEFILENRIFCFRWRHISLFGGSFLHFWRFLIFTFPKKTSKIATFIVRRFKKNEWCEHKRAVRKKRAFCDASQ